MVFGWADTQPAMKPQPDSLNPLQVQLIQTLYKFRFATPQLIAKSQGRSSGKVVYTRLMVLKRQGYVGQRYYPSYRLSGKPARYFLLPRAIRYLRRQPGASTKALNRVYSDQRAVERSVDHYLNVFRTYIEFKRLYPEAFSFFSKSEHARYSYFPKMPPDAYLIRLPVSGPKTKRYWLDMIDGSSRFYDLSNRIRHYVRFADSETWQKKTISDFPLILLVCLTPELESQVLRLAAKYQGRTIIDVKFVTTTLAALEQAKDNEAIWKLAGDGHGKRRRLI